MHICYILTHCVNLSQLEESKFKKNLRCPTMSPKIGDALSLGFITNLAPACGLL